MLGREVRIPREALGDQNESGGGIFDIEIVTNKIAIGPDDRSFSANDRIEWCQEPRDSSSNRRRHRNFRNA